MAGYSRLLTKPAPTLCVGIIWVNDITVIKDGFRVMAMPMKKFSSSGLCLLPFAFLKLDVVLLEIPQANEPS